MESTPGEDAVKLVKMTTKELEYDINLVDKAKAEFERIDFNFEKSSVDKMLLKSIVFYRKIVQERITGFANFIVVIFSYFMILPYSYQPSAATTLFVRSRHHCQGKTLHQQKDYNLLTAQIIITVF